MEWKKTKVKTISWVSQILKWGEIERLAVGDSKGLDAQFDTISSFLHSPLSPWAIFVQALKVL